MVPTPEGISQVPTSTEDVANEEVSTNLKRIILFGAATTTIATLLGTAFLPYLVTTHPMWLLASSSDGRNLVLIAPVLDLPTVLLIAIPRRVFGMMVVYGLGMIYGRAMLAWSTEKLPRLGRILLWLERMFLRFRRTVLLVWPTYITSILAGVSRTKLQSFVPFMVLGQVGYVLLSFMLGDAISEFTDRVIGFLARHVWESTAVCVTLVGLQQLVALLRRRRVTVAPSE
jgi:membrane protein DedA with SNARE-associated domain